MQNTSSATVNELLRKQRLQRGWSQQYIADQLGIAVGTFNRWERGRQQPTAYYIQRLTALFGQSAEELGLKKEKLAPEIGEQPEPFSPEREVNHLKQFSAQISNGDYSSTDAPPSTPSGVISPPPPPHSFSMASLSTRRSSLLALLALLLIGGGVLFFALRHDPTSSSSTTSPSTRSHSLASPLPSDLASLEPKPVFTDPMTQQRDDIGWSTGRVCRFDQGTRTYRMTSIGINYCLEKAQTFHNLVYQIDVSIQKGLKAGLVFRADANSNLYYFSVDVSGQYEVDVELPSTTKVALQGHSAAIPSGLSHWNTLTVAASDQHLTFWANNTRLGQIDDSSYTSGNVGVCAGDYNDPSQSMLTDALFRNAQVWQIS